MRVNLITVKAAVENVNAKFGWVGGRHGDKKSISFASRRVCPVMEK